MNIEEALVKDICSSKREEQLRAVIELSQLMLQTAQQKNWDDLRQLERNRQELFKSFFSQAASEAEAVWIGQGIEQILSINQKMIQIIGQEQTQLMDNMKTISNGRQAVKAYSR